MPRPDARQLSLPFDPQFGNSRISELRPAPPARSVVMLPTTASRSDRLRNERVRALKELGAWWRDRR